MAQFTITPDSNAVPNTVDTSDQTPQAPSAPDFSSVSTPDLLAAIQRAHAADDQSSVQQLASVVMARQLPPPRFAIEAIASQYPGVSQDAAYGFNTMGNPAEKGGSLTTTGTAQAPQGPQGPSSGSQGYPEAPQGSQLSGATWNQLINGVGNAVLHPIDTAEKLGNTVKEGAIDAGQRLYDNPLKAIDDAVRGVADFATFGTADKIAAKADQITGRTGANTYDQNLANQRAQDKAGGAMFHLGQIGGAVLPGVGQVGLVNTAAKTIPSASLAVRALAGAGAGAAEGAANYLGHNDGPVNASDLTANMAVSGALGPLGTLGGPTGSQRASTFLRDTGGDLANAQRDATVIGDLSRNGASNNPMAVVNGYTRDAANQVQTLAQYGAIDGQTKQALMGALGNAQALTDSQINSIRQLPHGDAVADAIMLRQRAQTLVTGSPESSGTLRDIASHVVSHAIGHTVGNAIAPGAGFYLQPMIRKIVSGGSTGVDNVTKALGRAKNAQALLDQYGPTIATQTSQDLAQAAQKAIADRQAQSLQANVDRLLKERNGS